VLQTILGVMNEVPVGICTVDKALQVQLVNRRAMQLLDLPDHLFEPKLPHFSAVIAFNAERGDYGPGDTAEHVSRIQALAQRMEPHHFERKRPNGQVLDIRGEPLLGGGFVTIWTDVTARAGRRGGHRPQHRAGATQRRPSTGAATTGAV
jgi:PAS domain-containing protein